MSVSPPEVGDASAAPTGVQAGRLEEAQVRAMFDRIAGLYDRMNTVMTAGLHRTWRRRAVVLEITTPRRRALSTFFELWFDRVVPVLGRVAGDAQAYSYLPSSVRRFPGPEQLAGVMARSGLGDVRYFLTAGGIVALH